MPLAIVFDRRIGYLFPMEQSELRAFEKRCTQEEAPACQTACPLHVDARAFCGLMAAGRLSDARKLLERSMPLADLLGRLCEGDCLAACRRAEIDAAVNMPLLERACVCFSKPAKGMLMPSTGKRVAVAGAGLSSLCLAWELGKKGHTAVIHHCQSPGGRLKSVNNAVLPEGVLADALDALTGLRVEFILVDSFSPAWRDKALEDHLALYIGLDDASVSLADFALGGISDFLTQETAMPAVFAGGAPDTPGGAPSFVRAAADGKRAAGSIIRLMQGVSPATARENEGVYKSLLHTNLEDVAPALPVIALDPDAPTEDEAVAEAARCIRCECLECVKHCVYLANYKGYPKRYAREIYNNLSVVHGLRRSNGQINSCAECGLCAAVCPNSADMGAFCASARREMARSNRMPPSAHEFALEDMAFSNAPDIAFFRHEPGASQSAWAFFPGCQLPASFPGQSADVYRHLRRHLPESGNAPKGGGGVGFFFRCCGAPARWSGRDLLTAESAASLRADWQQAGEPTLILACASCMSFFTEALPDIPVISLWDVLADLPLPEGAAAAGLDLALHDPCAARHSDVTRARVRALARQLGQEVEELSLGGALTRCCGYGGLASAANPVLGDAIALSRAKDTDRALLTWCAMCRDRLRAVGKNSLHLLDLLFPDGSAEQAATRPAPGISARQERRLSFRTTLLHDAWNENPPENAGMDSITLSMDEDTARKLDARRILRSDIKAVLLHAKDNGPQFANPDTGRSLHCLRPKQVTFWVEFTRTGDNAYDVHDAYCHRMVVPGVPGEGLDTAATCEGYSRKGGRM
ncbi:MAG: 4Fe-4S dicluster domain-containing protein [Desulfovibrio sp.]|jgi:Fe-S oxidoreductase|nr:4Fe-4S dicluster domain-containing protein [Desulfovibrio sp.]